MCFVYKLKPSNQETTVQILKTKPAFLPSNLTTHSLREEDFSLGHACRCGQTPGLGSLAPGGRPRSVGGVGRPAAAGGSRLCSGDPHSAGAPGGSCPSRSFHGSLSSPVPCSPLSPPPSAQPGPPCETRPSRRLGEHGLLRTSLERTCWPQRRLLQTQS